jgi:hypothetical protein
MTVLGRWPSPMLRHSADEARRQLVEIEALPVTEAAQLIQQKARRAAPDRMAEAGPQARTVEGHRRRPPPPSDRPYPRRDLGPSL